MIKMVEQDKKLPIIIKEIPIEYYNVRCPACGYVLGKIEKIKDDIFFIMANGLYKFEIKDERRINCMNPLCGALLEILPETEKKDEKNE